MRAVTESMPTRDRIVQAMAELMRYQGYGATSVKQVVESARAPIGSLYHFFPHGKRQLAEDALRSTGAAYIALVPLFMDPHEELPDAIEAFFAAAAEHMEQAGWATMCPVVSVGAEAADVEPALRTLTAEIVTGWIGEATDYFVQRDLDERSARELTFAALVALEGAFLIARVLRSTEPLHAAGRTVADQARSLQQSIAS